MERQQQQQYREQLDLDGPDTPSRSRGATEKVLCRAAPPQHTLYCTKDGSDFIASTVSFAKLGPNPWQRGRLSIQCDVSRTEAMQLLDDQPRRWQLLQSDRSAVPSL